MDEAKEDVEKTEPEIVDETNVEEEKVVEISELDKVKAEAENFKGKYYYLAAELDNTRKRFERERQNFVKFGNEKILKELISVTDNLDRTVDSIKTEGDEKIQSIVDGVKMIQKQFYDVLNANGLEQIDCLGKDFDPNFHEAMAQQPAEDKKDGEIIIEYQKGYLLNGRLLRASKVIVSKN